MSLNGCAMDELIQHCLRELSYDGDLGSNVTRLQESIKIFYENRASTHLKIDHAYCAFVWAVLVQQPNVRVGIVPEGACMEVYIAPQSSAKKKAKAKGEEIVEACPVALQVIPDASIRPLDELEKDYGENLRIAVDPDTIFKALTGSHIRESKLSPMVYSALQLIARGREAGISSVDLSRKSGYDPKTCHYLVNQLLSLNLVVKRSKTGVSTIVHKDLFKRDTTWRSIMDEENRAREEQGRKVCDIGSETEADQEDQYEEDVRESSVGTNVAFDPIDQRHLSSMDLVRGRITTLLASSPHGLHAANNLLPKLGFVNPNKSDRRYFIARCLNPLIRQGIIEKVKIPGRNSSMITCIRLAEESKLDGQTKQIVQDPDEEPEIGLDGDDGPVVNLTLHRQIVDLLAESGEKGMTLNELCSSLGNYDRRTVELLLERLHTNTPPGHLGDLGVAHAAENHGRERRYRYWTVSHYQAMVIKEGIPDQSYANVNLVATGGFMAFEEPLFYDDDTSLFTYVDALRQGSVLKTPRPARAHKQHKNPILPDGTVKRGRPRKTPATLGAEQETPKKATDGRGRKRKRGDDDASEGEVEVGSRRPTYTRKRGRPLTRQSRPTPSERPASAQEGPDEGGPQVPATRRRGCLPKSTQGEPTAMHSTSPAEGGDLAAPPLATKRRGRPRKHPLPGEDVHAAVAPEATGGSTASARENNTPVDYPLGDPDLTTETLVPMGAGTLVTSRQCTVHIIAEGRESTQVPQPAMTEHPVNGTDTDPPPTSPSAVQAGLRLNPNTVLLQEASEVSTESTEHHTVQEHVSAPLAMPEAPSEHVQLSGVAVTQAGTLLHDPALSQAEMPIDHTLLLGSSDNVFLSNDSLAGEVSSGSNPSSQESNIPSKRMQSNTVAGEPYPKRPRPSEILEATNRRASSKTRLVTARREKELLRVVKNAGGIINVSSKDFYEAHASLVETMAEAGEATSTRVGARMDKRTAEATLKELEAHGKVKIITTSVRISTGAIRPVRVVYLPEISEAELQAFLGSINIQQFPPQSSIKTLEVPIAFGRTNLKRIAARSSSVAQLHEGMVSLGAQESQANGDPVQAAVLNDKSTVAQMHGFINGKIARARALHAWLVDFIRSGSTSAHIISSRERVICFSLLLNDLPITLYCAVVSSQVQNEELLRLLRSPEGQTTPVGEIPDSIRDALQIGRWRSRERLLDIMELLCRLDVIHSLVPSHAITADVNVDPIPNHPTSFDVAPAQTWTPLTGPAYFRLNTSAPLHLWALSEDSPPFWRSVTVFSVLDCNEYWTQLQLLSQDKDAAKQIPPTTLGAPFVGAGDLGRILRRPSSWSTSYMLSPTQEAFLKQHVDLTSGATPLQDENGARLDALSAITFAPREAIMRYYDNWHDKIMRDKAKIARKAERRAEEAKAREARSKTTIAQRAAEAKARREKDWEDIVAKVHPGPLTVSAATRIRRLRAKFLQSSGKNYEKWEGEIAEAIQESIFAAKQTLAASRAPLVRPAAAPALLPPVVSAAPAKSVRELVDSQGPRIAPRQPTRKPKKGKEYQDDDTPKGPSRRQRFQWTREYDELARDASAIVRARCRGHNRIDLAALSQAFPAVPRNSVRQRIVHLRESPGADTYLQRLEDKWYDVWIQHRGTDALPDDDPDSPSNFDMITHLEFLRKHVDKNALRVGFVELSRDADFTLPCDVHQLCLLYEVQEKPIVAPQFDFVWSLSAEESREKQLSQYAFTNYLPEIPPVAEYSSEALFVADSAMKMVLSTPTELCDMHAATELLQSIGENPVKIATETMLVRGVLSKVVRDPSKGRPGRTLKISDSNQNAIGGSVPQDVFQDASALDDVLRPDDDPDAWREWSLLSSDGDMAALLDMVSNNKVEFKVDTSNPRTRRSAFDWNSKKADDDDIETGIMVRIVDETVRAAAAITNEDAIEGAASTTAADYGSGNCIPVDITPVGTLPLDAQHGKSWDGDTAFCRQITGGPVNCQACLLEAQRALARATAREGAELANRILDELYLASSEGLEKTRILQIMSQQQSDAAGTALAMLTSGDIPLAYWTGYTSVVLVAAGYIRPWTVTISQSSGKKMLFPRRWLDVLGRRIDEVWEAALRAVIGVVLFRPGISQAEIRWRLRSVYDRQEVHDALRWLLKQGYVERRVGENVTRRAEMGIPDDEEERHVHWFVSEGWYDV